MDKRLSKNRRGQGVVEYILVTALVALAMIAVFKKFRADLTTAYKTAGDALVQGVQQSVTADTTP